MIELPRACADEFITDQKMIVGAPDWTDDHRKNERRMAIPLSIGGVTSDGLLVLKAFPNHEEPKFTIMLVYNVCVWRLCYTTDAGHLNPLIRPNGLPIGPIDTPHYHSWTDNRPASDNAPLPKRLRFANFLPENLTDFTSCFRWFCEQTNILVADRQVPILPKPDRLL